MANKPAPIHTNPGLDDHFLLNQTPILAELSRIASRLMSTLHVFKLTKPMTGVVIAH